MSAPRIMSYRALRQLSQSNAAQQVRNLHMTGPATFSTLLTSERPAINLPEDIAGLRAECQKRKLPTTGTKAELVTRLSAHESVGGSRAFSTAIQDSKRPVPNSTTPSNTPARHFNTSRSLKAVKDSSTIDFAYLPDWDPDTQESPILRVPILPQTVLSESHETHAAEVEETFMRPQIMTVSSDGAHIHAPSMSEPPDAGSVDFQSMAAKVAEKWSKPVDGQVGMVKEVWSNLLDDMLGPKQGPAKA